jgi:hypothetical protein
MARGNDLVDEGGPVMRPFLLKDRDQDQVQLVQERPLRLVWLLVCGVLDDEVDNEVSDSFPRSAVAIDEVQLSQTNLDIALEVVLSILS